MKEKIKKHKKSLIIVSVIIVIAAVMAGLISRARNARSAMLERAAMSTQDTALIERRTLVDSISATGIVTSVDNKSVTANVTGVEVVSINVEVGDKVEAGDVICILDTTDIEADLADAKVSLNAASGKTDIDLSASARSLRDAEATRDIEAERADQDATDAWNDFLVAMTDLQEAENDYNNAIGTTKAKKEGYEYRKGLMEEAEADGTLVSTDRSSQLELRFSNVKNELSSYSNMAVGNKIVSFEGGMLSNIYIGNPDLPDYLDISKVKLVENDAARTAMIAEDETVEAVATAEDETAGAVENIEDESVETVENVEDETAGAAVNAEDETAEAETTADTMSTDESKEDEEKILGEIKALLIKLKDIWSQYTEAKSEESDYQSLQTEVNEWEQEYNTAKNEESSLKTAYEQAITTAENKLDTYNQKVRSKEDTVRNNDSTVNTKKDNLETSRLNATTSGLSDKQQIEQYEKQIEACTITAPISGIVTERNVEVGEVYSGAAVVTIEDISNYEISSEIDEYDISLVEVGQKVVIKTNGTGDTELVGTVKKIAPRATAGGADVTYKVIISVDTPCKELKMDMTAKLSIILESKADVLTVPYDSVQEDEEGNFYIETINGMASQTEAGMAPSGMAPEQNRTGTGRETEKIIITKGIESDYYVEIIGNGIKEGMTVIVPSSENENMSIQEMMNRRGPMGGF